jgi:hypothetical protein
MTDPHPAAIACTRMTAVRLAIRTVSEMNARGHWSARARRMKAHRQAAYVYTSAMPLPCVVTLTRVSAGTLDDDNLRSALKGVRDGVADRLGCDDADPRIRFEYGQVKGKRGEYAVLVDVRGVA